MGETMKCSVKDCETVLELDLSFTIKICRWCRREMQPSWDDDDWFDEFMNSIEADIDDSNEK